MPPLPPQQARNTHAIPRSSYHCHSSGSYQRHQLLTQGRQHSSTRRTTISTNIEALRVNVQRLHPLNQCNTTKGVLTSIFQAVKHTRYCGQHVTKAENTNTTSTCCIKSPKTTSKGATTATGAKDSPKNCPNHRQI